MEDCLKINIWQYWRLFNTKFFISQIQRRKLSYLDFFQMPNEILIEPSAKNEKSR